MSNLATRLESDADRAPTLRREPVAVEPAPLPPASFLLEPGSATRHRDFAAVCHSDLATIAPLWRTLERDGTCSAYQRFEWAEAIDRHLAGSPKRRVIAVEVRDVADGRPILLFPFVVMRRLPCVMIEGCDLGVSDYAGPVMAPDLALSAEEVGRIWSAVKAVLPKADLLQIDRIPATLMGRPNPLATVPNLRRSAMHASGIVLEGPPETLMRRIATARVMRDLAKTRRGFEEVGEPRFVEASTPAEVTEIFDTIVTQRRKRFQEMGRFDLLTLPHVEAFYRDAALRGLDSGLVRLFGVKLGEDWVAASYGLIHGGAHYGILLAMAGGRWSRLSPGLYLVAEIMVWGRRQGLGYFDCTIGAMPYKARLGAKTQELYDLSEALTFRGAVVEKLLRRAAAAKIALQRHPVWFERLRKIRRELRRRFKI